MALKVGSYIFIQYSIYIIHSYMFEMKAVISSHFSFHFIFHSLFTVTPSAKAVFQGAVKQINK